ncbi:MAG: hypothetical protein QNJ62_09000 [Methyloceanibacter sp.]|nr:hypothetical protein [Methyloceanibacter sp.]
MTTTAKYKNTRVLPHTVAGHEGTLLSLRSFLRQVGWAGVALALLTAPSMPASASMTEPNLVCGSYNPTKKSITLQISNRCTSAGNRYQGHDIEVDVVEASASITVRGNFKYDPPDHPVITRDCMGTQRLVIEVPDVEARRYSIFADSALSGTFDFTKSTEKQCLRRDARVHSIFLPNIAASVGKKKLIDELLPAREGSTIQQIIEPLLRPLSISGEGRGSLELSIAKDHGGQKPQPKRAVAVIEAHGLGDDPVSALRYTLGFVATETGWEAVRLQHEQMCVRGRKTGQWTHGRCS